MITVTPRAKQRLSELMRARTSEPGTSIRLEAAGPGSFGLVPDRLRPGDHVVEYEGLPVLLLSSELAERLAGWSMDYDDSRGGSEVMLRPGTRPSVS